LGRIVVLGASGYVGAALSKCLVTHGHHVVAVSRSAAAPAPDIGAVTCEATDPAALSRVVRNADYVVNCINARASDSTKIARNLLSLLRDDCVGRIVHLSSLAVFGQTDGILHECSRPIPALGHRYAAAKLKVERVLAADDALSARCLVIRLGCIYGPHAPVWVDRLLRLIHAGRLGSLGQRGQGICPLINLTDVAKAVARGIATEAFGIHHLISPGRLSWNSYFQLLGTLSGVGTLGPQGWISLATQLWLMGPVHRGLNVIRPARRDNITPAMTRLFSTRATFVSIRPDILKPEEFVPVAAGLAEAVGAFYGGPLSNSKLCSAGAPSQKVLIA
jgi:nucleoside-diphosphate-sugar epimerase